MAGLLEKYDIDINEPINFDIDDSNSTYLASFEKLIIAEIINFEDDCLKNKLIEYAKSYAKDKKKNIELILLDEAEVKKVIDYGINEYIRRNKNG